MSDTPVTSKKRRKNSADWKPEFLAALAREGVVQAACVSAGVDRMTAYRHKASDAAFSEAWATAIDVSIEALESEADRRGRDGVAEPVYYQGVQVGTIQRYSDGLLMFRLKALRPEKYREPKGDTTITINDERNAADPAAAKAALDAAAKSAARTSKE